MLSSGEEGEQCHLSTSVRSRRVYGVDAGRQSRKSGAECSQQELLLEMFFPLSIPRCGSECIGVKRKSELLEIVNVRVGY